MKVEMWLQAFPGHALIRWLFLSPFSRKGTETQRRSDFPTGSDNQDENPDFLPQSCASTTKLSYTGSAKHSFTTTQKKTIPL
ncbi:hypothetical protein Y1Q_0007614 [Alligator mississippiensis]|uniref:Uncharacterized protein n=1 Tax=Alligator mississippiensis TaxID=8496 RepID=A0A151NCK1_ALLMI|nr:hypothetical protein Y1Q_0007614 [Alligator mississippiensis]